MDILVRKVPHKIGRTPLPDVIAAAAGMLDEFAERDRLVDAPVVAGQLRSLMLALQDGRDWEPDEEETVVDRLHTHFAQSADGPQAARQLARVCTINPDKSITIKPEHGILLVRMCTALGSAGPFLVDLMRRGAEIKGLKRHD